MEKLTIPEFERVPVDQLIVDYDLYPRVDIDEVHVRDLMEAIRAGATLPPIVVWRATMKVADGVNRLTAQRRLKEPRISVRWRDYPDEAAFYKDAVDRNASHGLKFSPYDRTRIIVRAQELGLDKAVIASVLHISGDRLDEITVRRTAIGPGAIVVPIKGAMRHLAGSQVSQEQVVAMHKVGGPSVRYHADQLLNAIEHGLIDPDDERLSGVLERLLTALAGLRKELVHA